NPREEVAAELVGRERVIEAEAGVGLREVDRVRVVVLERRPDPGDLPKARDEEAVEAHDDEDNGGDDSTLVLKEAPPGVLPQAGLPDRRAGGVLGGRRRRGGDRDGCLAAVDCHQRTSLVLGSRMPYMMSTKRFAMMMISDVSTVIPITTEKSRLKTELMKYLPMPGIEKMISMMN